MENFGDPQFTAHQAVGRVWGRIALMIATTPLLPYHPLDYAKRLNETYSQLIGTYGSTLVEQNITTGDVDVIVKGCPGDSIAICAACLLVIIHDQQYVTIEYLMIAYCTSRLK